MTTLLEKALQKVGALP